MYSVLPGKVVQEGLLGNSPHNVVWYNRTHEEFTALTAGKTVGTTSAHGRWLFFLLEPGYVLVFGECGGELPRIMNAVKTPIPGVYQAGQWTYSPSGLPIALLTGKIAADQAIKDLKKGKA